MGVNDVTILGGLITFFIILGTALPFINEGFGNDTTTTTDVDGFSEDLTEQAAGESSVSFWRVLTSLITIFFWSYGELGVIMNVVLLIPRTLLIVIIARNVWVGGGS